MEVKFDPNMVIQPGEVEDAINKLTAGKSCGLDGIYAEHLKHCSVNLRTLLAQCMTSFLVHDFQPDSLKSVIVVPTVRHSDICSSHI